MFGKTRFHVCFFCPCEIISPGFKGKCLQFDVYALLKIAKGAVELLIKLDGNSFFDDSR